MLSDFEDRTYLQHLVERNLQLSRLVSYNPVESPVTVGEALAAVASSLGSASLSLLAVIEPFAARVSSAQL